MSDKIKVIGNVKAIKTNTITGEVTTVEDHNLVVQLGLNRIAAILYGSGSGFVDKMAVGTGTTAPVITDTALEAEISRKAAAGSLSSNIISYTTTWNPGEATGTLTEFGLFSDTGPILISRSTSIVVDKGVADLLQIIWEVRFN